MGLGSVSGETVPKRAYVEAFRIVCWQFLEYQSLKQDISPEYDECPETCFKFRDDERNGSKDYCEGCEVRIAKESFETYTKEYLNEKLGNKWEKYKFEKLVNTLYDVFDLKNSKNVELTPTTDVLIGILISEQNKQRRRDDYNRKRERDLNG